ncbi:MULTISPECIES: Lsr2 dimerization domain-containing protein [Nocardia]|uniref:Lsr2 dimerization domain-containing protein n=1 Tax=Nocardia TaxID=1817 RepID=UPI00313B6DE1
MARKVTVELVDDYDGQSKVEGTVVFGLDSTTYEIDLSVLNASALRGSSSSGRHMPARWGESPRARAWLGLRQVASRPRRSVSGPARTAAANLRR